MFSTPYRDDAGWLRGNLHTHTTNSDGQRDPQVVVDDYAARGYDFLAISDHDFRTDVEELDDRGMVLIGANEVTARGPHLLHVGTERVVEPNADRQTVLDAIADDPGSIAILAHPNWHSNYGHYPQSLMERLDGYVGIEIYNGVIERLQGSSFALDRWDRLLSQGRRVWGFAHDDSHRADDVALGWNVVQAERDVASILDALRRGAFYASTGVELETLGAEGRAIFATASEEVRWELRQQGARRIWVGTGRSMRWEAPREYAAPWVRLEAHGALGRSAWTQPFFAG